MTRSQIEQEIAEFTELINDPDTPTDQKETFQLARAEAEKKLASMGNKKSAAGKEKSAAAAKPAKKGVAKTRQPKPTYDFQGKSTAECEEIYKAARKARKEKQLEDYKAAALKDGATQEAVDAMTFADMKPKVPVAERARDKAGSVVDLFLKNHTAKLASAPKGKADELKKKREELEKKAAKEVADFAKEKAVEVARLLKEFVSKLEKQAE